MGLGWLFLHVKNDNCKFCKRINSEGERVMSVCVFACSLICH